MKWSLKSTKTPKNSKELKEIIFDNRDIDTDSKAFFNPTTPLKITPQEVEIDEKQLKLIVKRIKEAKKNKEYIVIFGDYDADGICATAILWQTLYEMGCDVKPFIPNRKTHGYGVSDKAIDEIIRDQKPDLLITVDNGIVAHKPISYLKNQNIDVIVTDHHQPEMELGKPIFPNADFVLYSNKLCGATVAWMLARELNGKKPAGEKFSSELLDLCGIATIADQVKLTGANRSFAKFGIEAIKKSNRIGLNLLLEITVKDLELINSDTIGFVIAPRINAMGRMADGIVALRFLCTKSKNQAESLVNILMETNDERKSLTYDLLSHAEDQVKVFQDEHILIAHSDHYHEGILGLIAGAMLEKYHKPAIAISVEKDFAKASARSVPGVNIVDLLREIRDDLLEVGGHPMAAGFGFEPDKLESIKTRLFKLAKETISKDMLIKQIKSECVLPFKLVGDETIELINDFRPFGQGNRKPLFEIRNLSILEIVSMGQEGAHLRIMLGNLQGEKEKSTTIKAIGWRMGKQTESFEKGDKISVVGSLEHNVWNGRKSLQMILKDLKKTKA